MAGTKMSQKFFCSPANQAAPMLGAVRARLSVVPSLRPRAGRWTAVALSATLPAAPDPAAALTLVFALAATFVAVWLYALSKVIDRLIRVSTRRTRRRIRQSRRLLSVPRFGRALWIIDVSCVVGLRLIVGLYGSLVVLFIAPVLMTFGSVELAAAIVRVP